MSRPPDGMRDTFRQIMTAAAIAAGILTVAWVVFLALVGAAAWRVAFQ